MQNSELVACAQIMKNGSKSFSLAARLLDRRRREGAQLLYSWCRHCDDLIDSAENSAAALAALNELQAQTIMALEPAPSLHALAPSFRALAHLCQIYQIPALYPLELINGMEMDTRGVRIRTEAELRLYCYRVASVVGLMMCHIMGVRDPRALRHAVDTGLAMQMTNIARDIQDDYKMGRIYIPDEWFKIVGRERPEVETAAAFQAGPGAAFQAGPGAALQADAFTEVVQILLDRADVYYRSGQAGLKYLPWRAAFAVGAAQLVYREIGVRVRSRGATAWKSRTVVPLSRKLYLIMKAAVLVCWFKLRDRQHSTGRLQLRQNLFGPSDL